MGTPERSDVQIPQDHQPTNDIAKDKHRTTVDTCIICLSEITERAVATPCQHLQFDLVCLLQWLQASPTCPLCKVGIAEVQYDFRDVTDYKRYTVPQALQSTTEPQIVNAENRFDDLAGDDDGSHCNFEEDHALIFRRQIYDARLFSLHVGSNPSSGYQEYSPASFAASPALQSKTKTFLRRELQVFSKSILTSTTPFTSTSAGRLPRRRGPPITMEYMIEFIIAVLRTHTLKSFDARAEELVADFVGHDNAVLLLHELDAWLRSPFLRLEDWDETVQYHCV